MTGLLVLGGSIFIARLLLLRRKTLLRRQQENRLIQAYTAGYRHGYRDMLRETMVRNAEEGVNFEVSMN